MAVPVLLYAPNLIGYARIIFTIIAFHYAFTDFKLAGVFYTVGHVLDAADGYAARWLNQSTTFGAVLDMVTDRVSTAGLLAILAQLYQNYHLLFIVLLLLDISSHWFHMYSSLLQSSKSHKDIDRSVRGAFLLRLYYSRPILTALCLGNELFFIFLYLYHFDPDTKMFVAQDKQSVWLTGILCCSPVFLLKQTINVVQLSAAVGNLVDHDLRSHESKRKKQG